MESEGIPYANEVRICGRITMRPVQRTLPSGDTLTVFRVAVNRGKVARKRSKISVDAIDCVAWGKRVQTTLSKFEHDDVIEVHGELRRRFTRRGGTPTSRTEIDVGSVRRVRVDV